MLTALKEADRTWRENIGRRWRGVARESLREVVTFTPRPLSVRGRAEYGRQ